MSLSRHPEMNSVISLMVGMAPVAASTNMASPIKYIAPVADQVEVGQAGVYYCNYYLIISENVDHGRSV